MTAYVVMLVKRVRMSVSTPSRTYTGTMELIIRTGCTAPLFLNLGARLRWWSESHPCLYTCGGRTPGPTEEGALWIPEPIWMCWRRENLLPLPGGFEPRTVHHLLCMWCNTLLLRRRECHDQKGMKKFAKDLHTFVVRGWSS